MNLYYLNHRFKHYKQQNPNKKITDFYISEGFDVLKIAANAYEEETKAAILYVDTACIHIINEYSRILTYVSENQQSEEWYVNNGAVFLFFDKKPLTGYIVIRENSVSFRLVDYFGVYTIDENNSEFLLYSNIKIIKSAYEYICALLKNSIYKQKKS